MIAGMWKPCQCVVVDSVRLFATLSCTQSPLFMMSVGPQNSMLLYEIVLVSAAFWKAVLPKRFVVVWRSRLNVVPVITSGTMSGL